MMYHITVSQNDVDITEREATNTIVKNVSREQRSSARVFN